MPVYEQPYTSLPDKAFWRRTVVAPKPTEVDPVGVFDLDIRPNTKVATAGSCFAQHIARYLKQSGYNYFIAEPGHSIVPGAIRKTNNYGLFSCRYGNIYTARQLWQLFRRAYGEFTPQEDVWHEGPGVFLDPFRPTTQPGGFSSEKEMRLDRAQHLAAVRHMFETMDVFVFTLGLTECWRARSDGAVFPLCPGVQGGEFDADRYEFYNQPVEEVIADLTLFRRALARVNPDAQIIFTVSPVPLVATAEPSENVLSATTYSKSVLRVAAEALKRRFDNVHYFPSYEIITGAFNRGAYYASDLRNVLEDGVAHVMGLFMKYATAQDGAIEPAGQVESAEAADDFVSMSEKLVEVECDEIALAR